MNNIRFETKIVLFLIIFLTYFSSAAGLYNSMDSPQYFTTEALLQNTNPYIEVFNKDPHFFVFPDIFYYKNHTMGVRGYITSTISIPLHLLASLIHPLYNDFGFPAQATSSPSFTYELSITSLFVAFTVFGLYFFYQTMIKITEEKSLSTTFTLLLAFGTYMWKYSSSYIRQGLVVLILGMGAFFVTQTTLQPKRYRKWIAFLLVIWSISFGVDIFLFIGMSLYLIIYIISNVQKIRKLILPIFIASLIVLAQITFNLKWYNSPLSSQTVKQPTIKKVLGAKSTLAWLSTPLFPATLDSLLASGTINPKSFKNFKKLPEEVSIFASLEYAKKYKFYGLFIVSPFLFFLIFSILDTNFIKKHKMLLVYCLTLSSVGVLGNSKVLVFWGGNQYDIRYFFPYSLTLGLLAGVGLKWILSKERTRLISGVAFLISGVFSVFMGWFGVLNMFKPSLTGERRIWINLDSAFDTLSKIPLSDLLNNTFMNIRNVHIGMVLFIAFYLLGTLLVRLLPKNK